ncbi:MAG: TorF family putative porin [gamma proteobacterium symbiont of Bathyaustriella thionipta]|nr:TorF family putative porin [gamma proteobacterium symbiont of Bathyaustriella thionipta]
MKKTILAAAIAVVGSSPMMALAEDGSPHHFSGNLTLTTDYVFRGISQTDEHAAVQGGFDYSHDIGLYAGIWASNVDGDFFPGATAEFDFYGGYAHDFDVLTGLSWDIWALRYQYPGVDNSNTNTTEFGTSLGTTIGMFTPSFAINYSPDFFDLDKGWYYDLGVDVELPANFTLGAHYGWTRLDESSSADFEYDDWKINAGYSFKGFDFELAYTDTGSWNKNAEPDDIADSRVVFSVSREF